MDGRYFAPPMIMFSRGETTRTEAEHRDQGGRKVSGDGGDGECQESDEDEVGRGGDVSSQLLRRLGDRACLRVRRGDGGTGRPLRRGGATDFTFYLYNPAEPLLEGPVAEHGAATRDQFEQVAAEVFPSYRD
jgi:hypothetical protein